MNEVIRRYQELKEKIQYLEEDIKCTERALKRKKIDYLTKREYQNDLIMDHRELHQANVELGQLIGFMCENGLIDDVPMITPAGNKKK